jgi:hypothetical protein
LRHLLNLEFLSNPLLKYRTEDLAGASHLFASGRQSDRDCTIIAARPAAADQLPSLQARQLM